MKDNVLEYLGAGTTWVLTALQTEKLLSYINLILAILTTLITLCYTIYKWYRKAKQDGKITEEEIEELKEQIKENLKDGD